MRRRTFLTTSALAMSGFAGCLKSSGSSGTTTPRPQSLGTSVTHDKVTVTVKGYTTIDRYAVYSPGGERRQSQRKSFASEDYREPKTAGGQFLLVYVEAVHNGEGRQYFPKGKKDTVLYYGDEKANEYYPSYIFTNGKRDFPSYFSQVAREQAKARGAYPPFSAAGYLVFGVPERFKPAKVTLEMTWGWDKVSEYGYRKGETAQWKLPGKRSKNGKTATEPTTRPPTSTSTTPTLTPPPTTDNATTNNDM